MKQDITDPKIRGYRSTEKSSIIDVEDWLNDLDIFFADGWDEEDAVSMLRVNYKMNKHQSKEAIKRYNKK